MDWQRPMKYLAAMRLLRKILAIALVLLVAGSGAATAGPIHFHVMDASESLHEHLVKFSGHEAEGHYDHDADVMANASNAQDPRDNERAPANQTPDTDPPFHIHGCSHPAIVVQAEFVGRAEKVALAVWSEMNTSVRSLGHSPPRKPPRPFL
jgi:hypothetical protein